ncbi:MAG: hypothetical protein OEY30_02870 [Candidatus Bathyarchaeota archaeon]|nr:hypothetical protein [Candidatus Bathyarchaeota archaeon]
MKKMELYEKNLMQALGKVDKDWLMTALKNKGKLVKKMKERKTTFENLPIASVNADEMLLVKFLTEPRKSQKGKRTYAFADALLFIDWACWYKEEEKQCKAGDKVSMNLARHSGLLRAAEKHEPLKDKELAIFNLGKHSFETKQYGTVTGYSYRIVPVEDVKAMLKTLKEA